MTDTPKQPSRDRSFGPLWDLLFAKFPDHRTSQGILDVPRLAKELGRSPEYVYRMLRPSQMTPEQGLAFVKLSDGRITPKDLSPFVVLNTETNSELEEFIAQL